MKRTEIHNALRPYLEQSYKTTTVPISVLNNIFSKTDCGLYIYTRNQDIRDAYDVYCQSNDFILIEEFEAKYYCRKLSVSCTRNLPSTVVASSILGINILDWKWDLSGRSVEIQYTDPQKRYAKILKRSENNAELYEK